MQSSFCNSGILNSFAVDAIIGNVVLLVDVVLVVVVVDFVVVLDFVVVVGVVIAEVGLDVVDVVDLLVVFVIDVWILSGSVVLFVDV